MTRYKTGKLPPKFHPRTLLLSDYLEGELPPPSAKVFREYKTPAAAKQLFGNDKYGCCTCAGIANLIVLWTVHTGAVIIPTLSEVLTMYGVVCPGFDPITDTGDNGAAMTDVLAYMQTTGLAGQKILGWAAIDPSNLNQRRVATDLFGATYTGVQLPDNAQDQFGAGQPWELADGYPPDPNEGHCIIHPGYGAAGGDYVTWGNWEQKASAAWEAACIDEEYVVISQNWINQATQLTPGGLKLAALQSDLALLRT